LGADSMNKTVRNFQVIDKSLSSYLLEIREYPILSKEEEIELTRKTKEGDVEALSELIQSNLRFVISVAKRFQNLGMSMGDLIGEGNVGLMKAAYKFDETRGVRFISYAVFWVRHAIMDALSRQTNVTRIPLSRARVLSKMRKEVNKLEQRLGRNPSDTEIADSMGIETTEVKKLEEIIKPGLSLEAPRYDGDEGTLLEYLPDSTIGPEEDLRKRVLTETINDSLSTLTERQSRILELYYGLNGNRPMTLEQIGEIFGVTRERIRQVREQALKRLRHPTLSESLAEYL
jgi:RNA polymerase primary sigma factor